MIEHTFLQAAGAPDAVGKLCREAALHRFACAMVNPCEVAAASRLLDGSGVRTGSVVSFPLGASRIDTSLHEAAAAVEDGASELDLVVNVRRLKAAATDAEVRRGLLGDLSLFNSSLKACGAGCAGSGGAGPGARGISTKLILECCYLDDGEKVLGCRLAMEAGFDFVKTSTGFGTGGATVHDVRLMRETVGGTMGVKAAGGIRTLKDALAMAEAGANRLGCSAGVKIMEELEASGAAAG